MITLETTEQEREIIKKLDWSLDKIEESLNILEVIILRAKERAGKRR